jgi:maltodextrin utilization protein YvdJ
MSPHTSILTDRTKAGADAVMPDLKRKSAAKDDMDRMKSMKIDEEERVLVGDQKEKMNS